MLAGEGDGLAQRGSGLVVPPRLPLGLPSAGKSHEGWGRLMGSPTRPDIPRGGPREGPASSWDLPALGTTAW